MKHLAALLGVVALSIPLSRLADEKKNDSYVEVDYAKVDRKIAKEPFYTGKPLYALLILDDAGKFRCWAVLDKSRPSLSSYDILYFDTKGDGDLTVSEKRFAPEALGEGTFVFTKDKLAVPGTDIVHTDLRFEVSSERTGVVLAMKWAGKEKIAGGHAPSGYDYTTWGNSPATAPVLRPSPNGPLAFAIWGEPELKLEGETQLSLLVGSPDRPEGQARVNGRGP
ncbi:hypothetical protein HY251_04385 [bacterium]|nr:hypothetical protein [bacterium]